MIVVTKIRVYDSRMDPTIYKRSPEAKEEKPRALSLKFKDRSIHLTKKFVIGRDAKNDIPLAADPLVSRRHAMIEFVQGTYYIHDLNSTNGTYVNNTPLGKGQKLALDIGDVITIGKTSITVSSGIIG